MYDACNGDVTDRNILIVGCNASPNYGTCSQSLALYRILSARYSCSLLWERRRLPLRSILRHLGIKRSEFVSRYPVDEEKQRKIAECYASADKTYINSRKQLKDALKRFSVFLVGGDQLWNPYLVENTYLLDFVPNNKRKVSYATSVGVATLSEFSVSRYKKYLRRFDSIAMRDTSGAKSMSETIGKPIDVVLDPVFLLSADEWAEFADWKGERREDDYALFYFVGEECEYIKKAEQTARDKNLRVTVVPMRDSDFSIDGTILSGVGMRDFLRLVIGASHIFTDSYHMCAFSIIFGKNFSVFKRFEYDNPSNPNARVDELLEMFGIDRDACTVEPSAEDIERRRRIIERERERSLGILYRAVEGGCNG